MKRAYIFGASLAVIMGCITWGLPIRHDMRWLLALAVSLIAWRLFRRKVASKRGVRPGTRKWARCLYHNGIISIGELNEFYLTHPESEPELEQEDIQK